MYDFINELPTEILEEESLAGGRMNYRLLKSKTELEGESADVYGIQVSSTLFDGKESALLMDISTDYQCVKKLFSMVVENIVLPCTLKDITEDYLVANM